MSDMPPPPGGNPPPRPPGGGGGAPPPPPGGGGGAPPPPPGGGGGAPPPPPGGGGGAPPPPPGGGAQPGGGGAAGVPGPLASWGQRVIAFLLTGLIIFAVFIVLFIVGAILGAVSDILGGLFLFLTWLLSIGVAFYMYYLDGETGGHPGKRLMGLKTVNAQTGQTIGGGMGIVRYLAHFIDSIICYIGYLFPLWDEKRQTIADKMLTTVVLSDQPKMDFGPDLFKP